MIITLKELVVKFQKSNEAYQYIKEQLISLYNQLSTCTNIKDNDFLDFVNRNNVFIEINEKTEILGVITALYEQKMIHNGGIVCHIEDLVVRKEERNKGIGKSLIEHVITDAENKGCYKVILDCTIDMKSFYEKCNFEQKNVQMSYYFV